MTRIQALIGAAALAGSAVGIERLAAQQSTTEVCKPRRPHTSAATGPSAGRFPCTQHQAALMSGYVGGIRPFQPLSELNGITVPDGVSLQVAAGKAGYIFSIRDTSNAFGCAVFLDHTGVIYEAQPIR